ncbi:hypothetical protein CFI10_16970 [Marinobacterium iners]|nr:hypothetical protein CFI10_16970 [Marinobacterium iners]
MVVYLEQHYYLLRDDSGVFFLQNKANAYLMPVNADSLTIPMKDYAMRYFAKELTDGMIKNVLDLFCGLYSAQSVQVPYVECGRGGSRHDHLVNYYVGPGMLWHLYYDPIQQQCFSTHDRTVVPLMLNRSAQFDYKYHHTTRPADLENLFRGYSVPESEYLILITWMVSTLVYGSNVFLLELIDSDDERIHKLQRDLKNLIDFCGTSFIPEVPSKRKGLEKLALDHYVMSFSPVDNLTASMQKNLLDLLNGYTVDAELKPKRHSYSVFIQRPVLLSADESVITHGPLLNRSITLYLSRLGEPTGVDMSVPFDTYFSAWLQLTVCVKHHVHGFLKEHINDHTSPMEIFREVGLQVCKCLNKDENLFLNELAYQVAARQELSQSESPAAQALIAYLDHNSLCEQSMPVSDWLDALEPFRPKRVLISNWPANARALGAALKKAKSVLAASNIECFGKKRGSYRVLAIRRSTPLKPSATD